MNNRKSARPIVYLLTAAILIALFSGLLSPRDNTPQVEYSQVLDFFRAEQVSSFVLKDTKLTLKLREAYENSDTVTCEIGDAEVFHRDLDDLIARQYEAQILTQYDYQPAEKASVWTQLLPTILIALVLGFVMILVLGRMNGGPGGMANFTKADAQFGAGKAPVTFADVAGAEEEKEELAQIVDYLRDPKRYSEMGARIPKGVLLVGPPGTGKTLLARAVAGEAGVAFLSISGSDFVELYVGVGASRVRSLFEQAKKLSPAIVFIDEIDAVGRQRGSGLGGGHDEREQTLNQLLVEMDGFGKNEGVIVMAATNRKDILDPALLRPGRFDRQIYIGTPDWRGRLAILKVHARDKRLAEDADLSVIAKATAGFTGADLENLLNEAALLAVTKRQECISMQDLEDSIIKVIAGPEKKSRVVSEHERKLTAYHEAGHAILMHLLKTLDPVHQITILPHGAAGGMTISLPEDDTNYLSRNEMYETIVSLMGGRVAEALKLGDVSTGASNDIHRATEIARNMVTKYGMSAQIGPVDYSSGDEIFVGRSLEKTKPYSERVAGDIDEEVRRILQKAYERAEKILIEQDEKLEAVTAYLLEHNVMNREQFEQVMDA